MRLWPFGTKDGPISKQVAVEEQKAATRYDLSTMFLTGQELVYGAGGIDGAYSSSWVAYSCIKKLATDASGVPILFLSDKDDPDSAVPASHPTRRLFERPSPYFSTGEFIQWIVTMLNMRGEFFIPFDDPMRPSQMIPETDPIFWRDITEGLDLLGWQYQHKGVSMLRHNDEMIHHRLVNPTDVFRGQSPLKAAAKAFQIETGAEELTLNIVNRGGERAALFQSKVDVTPEQRQQAVAMLKGRRRGNATVGQDVILPNGVEPIDPKFIEDDEAILAAAENQPEKICAVYGVPKSLLGFGSEEKYSNAIVKKRTYYEDTVVPMMNGICSSFDRYFIEILPSKYRCYVRFDWSAVPAMQDNIDARFKMAGEAHKNGIPWSVLNERFSLGLNVSDIPGADTVMISSTLAPLERIISEWSSPAKSQAGPERGKALGDGQPPLTNALILKRARDPRSVVQRGMRILRQEKEFRKEWRALLQKRMAKAVKLARGITGKSDVKKTLAPAFTDLGSDMADIAEKHHRTAAKEGTRAIVELVEGKMIDASLHAWKSNYVWDPATLAFIKKRRKLIRDMGPTLFEDIIGAIVELMDGQWEVSDITNLILDRFKNAPGGLSRAVTIARTEVGTAYNTARFNEMKQQEFEEHRWITNGDELVREPPESEFDHAKAHDEVVKIGERFSTGLLYPQEDGGDPGNVINCRCEAIPVVRR